MQQQSYKNRPGLIICFVFVTKVQVVVAAATFVELSPRRNTHFRPRGTLLFPVYVHSGQKL